MVLKPQEGYQEKVLSTSADICISGAAAGVGKTFALLMEFVRHIDKKGWGGVIFRRTTPQIRNEGGLWDSSMKIYPHLGAKPVESVLEWNFPKGAKLKFSHLEYEKDKLNWQGSEVPFIGFDELTHFTESTFFYLLSRSRSTCGVQPYVRATCNPDPDSWVSELIAWWIDKESGFPIKERDGVLRYFTRHNGEYIWGDTRREVIEKTGGLLDQMVKDSQGLLTHNDFIKSITFISGSIFGNKELLKTNPQYLANLNSQDAETKAQLLDGNWRKVENKMDVYEHSAFSDIFTNEHVPFGHPYISSDIAMDGSDKFVIWVWKGFVVVDVLVMSKSDSNEIISGFKSLKIKHSVPERDIVYDCDGVGSFLKGFFPNATSFKNGGVPLMRENYKDLKTQCFYKSGERVKENGIYIIPEVANKPYSESETIKQRLIKERRAIKKYKVDMDGKKQINPKSEQKIINGGESPDLLDALMQREFFAIANQRVKLTGRLN